MWWERAVKGIKDDFNVIGFKVYGLFKVFILIFGRYEVFRILEEEMISCNLYF